VKLMARSIFTVGLAAGCAWAGWQVFASSSAWAQETSAVGEARSQEGSPQPAVAPNSTRYIDFGLFASASDFAGAAVQVRSPMFWNQSQVSLSIALLSTDYVSAAKELDEKQFTEYGVGFHSRLPATPLIAVATSAALKFAHLRNVTNLRTGRKTTRDLQFYEFRFGALLLDPMREPGSDWHFVPEIGIQMRHYLNDTPVVAGGQLIRRLDPGVYIGIIFGRYTNPRNPIGSSRAINTPENTSGIGVIHFGKG